MQAFCYCDRVKIIVLRLSHYGAYYNIIEWRTANTNY